MNISPSYVDGLEIRIAELEQLANQDNRRLEFVESHPGWLRHHKKHWQCVNPFTSYEYSVFETAREAIDAALAQQGKGGKS